MPCFDIGFPRPIPSGRAGKPLKSYQSGTVSVNATSVTVTISAVNLSNAIVRISFVPPTSGNQSRTWWVAAELTNTTTITFTLNYYFAAVSVFWEVIEFNGVKSLQRGTSIGSTSIASVNTSKSLVFASWTTSESSLTGAPYELVEAYLSNSTALTFAFTNGNGSKTIKWQVIEFF